MKPSKYKRKKIDALIKKTRSLYKKGNSVREVALLVDRSPSWVGIHIKDLSTGHF